jgi:hypothetical protein
MIRNSSPFSTAGHRADNLLATDRWGKYRITNKTRGPSERRPSPMQMRLVALLEISNYVRAETLCPRRSTSAIPVLREAKMVLYSELRQIWMPDVGTYDWLVSIKQRMAKFDVRQPKGDNHVDTDRLRAPGRRAWPALSVSAARDRQPLRLEDARAASGYLSEGYSSFG